ncbi:unnamed protein product, partial [Brenthis ino]
MSKEKKYGLIVREKSKTQLTFQASHNVFGSDSESDNDAGRKSILLQPNSKTNRQSKISQEKAVMEDPTVYQYDEVYDSMVKEKEIKKIKSSQEKKPKYIENLLKTANKRKLENERRVERQIQKEREKEGDEFADKEVFVTSAYKKKLEEMHIEEEKEKYQDYLESIGDVTRQNDLGGFYRHLYEQKLGSDKLSDSNENNKEKCDESAEAKQETIVECTKKDKQILEFEETKKEKSLTQTKQRNYRKRKASKDNNLSEGEIEDSDDEINFSNLDEIKTFKKSKACNIDADSDFSIDESSDEESNDKNKEPKTPDMSDKVEIKISEANNEPIKQESPIKIQEKPKVKVDIWKKRTVGEVFEQALKRYYERKAARSA